MRNRYPASCCSEMLQTETDLDCHLVDVHHLHIEASPTSSTKLQIDGSAARSVEPSNFAESEQSESMWPYVSISPSSSPPSSPHPTVADPVARPTSSSHLFHYTSDANFQIPPDATQIYSLGSPSSEIPTIALSFQLSTTLVNPAGHESKCSHR